MFAPTRQKISDAACGRRENKWYCTAECQAESSRVYVDRREQRREDKRRQRARRHAKGLTDKGVPYRSKRSQAEAARHYVEPEITAHLQGARS